MAGLTQEQQSNKSLHSGKYFRRRRSGNNCRRKERNTQNQRNK